MGDLTLDNLLGAFHLFHGPSGLLVRGQRIANWRERIAQFMRKKSEELILTTIGFFQRFFALSQDFFCTLTVGNITRDFGSAHDGAAGVSDWGHGKRNEDTSPFLGDADRVEMVDPFALPYSREDTTFLVMEFRRNNDRDRLANGLVGRVSENPSCPSIPGQN